MLRSGLMQAAARRSISNNARIVQRNVFRKIKKGVDRLPSQGRDPSQEFKHGWRLASAAVIERYPVITPDIDPFEKEYNTGRFLDQQKYARPMPSEFFLSERDRVEGKTEPSFEDAQAELYTPGARVTEADERNDTKSMERALQERLYFVMRKTEKSGHMQFPQMLVGEDEVTMMGHAEMAFKNVTLGNSRPNVHFISYSPACHFEHVFPRKYQEKHDVYGVKIFFYRAMLVSGGIEEVRNAVDFMWARESELGDVFGKEYYQAIKPILLGVGPTIENGVAP